MARQAKPHETTPLAECTLRYNNIVEKLDGLCQRLDKINGRYEKHLEESIPYRAEVNEHREKFKELAVHRRFVIGLQTSTIITVILQMLTFSYLWGGITKQVEVNTARWTHVINSNSLQGLK